MLLLAVSAVASPHCAAAEVNGGSPSGAVTPLGRISEWPLPTVLTARDPAVDAAGNVFYAVARGDRIARFDTATRSFTEWKVPEGTAPHGVVIGRGNRVYFGGRGNGTIGELDPATGAVRVFRSSDPASGVYSLAKDAAGNIWFTERRAGRVGRLDPAKGTVSTWPMDGEPYGLAQDMRGRIWVTRIARDRIGVLDPRTGEIAEVVTGPGSRPRRIAVAADGMVWVTLYGTGKLIKVDPGRLKVVAEYEAPGGSNAGPYSVLVDREGRVWLSLFQTDSIALFDPRTERFRVIRLPERRAGVRNAAFDAAGRYWYVATTTGKLGMLE